MVVQNDVLYPVTQSVIFLGAAFLAGSNRLIQYFPGASRRGLVMAATLSSITSWCSDYVLNKQEDGFLKVLLVRVAAIAFATFCATHLARKHAAIPFNAAIRFGIIESVAATIIIAALMFNQSSEQLPGQPPKARFLSSELKTFRAALQKAAELLGGNSAGDPIKIEVGETQYSVWYNGRFGAINIQESHYWEQRSQNKKIGINIDADGRIQSIWINGEDTYQTTIPKGYEAHIRACFKETLKRSSEYSITCYGGVLVSVIRRGLREIPDFHLNEVTRRIEEAVRTSQDPKMRVSFLRDDLTLDEGVDAGGLTRDYVDDLLQAVTQSDNFSLARPSLLMLPKTKQPCTEKDPIPMLAQEEQQLFRRVGQLMMYGYHSLSGGGHWDSTVVLGRHFDEALFNATLCLDAKAINTPFDQLDLKVKMQIASALIQARINAGEGFDKCYLQRMEGLSKFLEENIADQELLEVAQQCNWAECLDAALCDDDEPDLAKIKDQRELFMRCLMKSIFNKEGSHGQLGSQIAAVHAIAQGMKSICRPGQGGDPDDDNRWNVSFCGENYVAFSNKVQGSLNRQEIADGIQLRSDVQGNAEIVKKVTWLKEWIRDEASDEDLRNFLKFTTGVSGFPQGRKITVRNQIGSYYPAPKAHTCDFSMEFSPVSCETPSGSFHDRDKEGFIKSLREIALTDLSGYGQA